MRVGGPKLVGVSAWRYANERRSERKGPESEAENQDGGLRSRRPVKSRPLLFIILEILLSLHIPALRR